MTRRTVLELADLAVKASAYNSIFRRAESQARAHRARIDERLTAQDAKLVYCPLCETWLYTGERDTQNRKIPAHRRSLAGHVRMRHSADEVATVLAAHMARGARLHALHALRVAAEATRDGAA